MPVSLPQRGRGAIDAPPNRFEPITVEPDGDWLDHAGVQPVATRYFVDTSRSIIATNDSPDVGFDASINVYRGCEHGCAYCYARPSHEYLGLNAGIDFESMIFVKPDAPRLLRAELSKRSWKPTRLAVSGVTDPYQPVERTLRLTRSCLEVLVAFRQPVSIVTKSHMVTRDIDLLLGLARFGAMRVDVSITTLDPQLSATMEPRAAAPVRRLDAIRQLAQAGVPVGVNVAPVVPGLTDHEFPAILEAASSAGARWAHLIVVRLPGAVRHVFEPWLRRHFPDRADKVLHRIMEMKGGRLNDPRFGHRFRGSGVFYEQVRQLFHLHRERLGLAPTGPELSIDHFRVPGIHVQHGLFD